MGFGNVFFLKNKKETVHLYLKKNDKKNTIEIWNLAQLHYASVNNIKKVIENKIQEGVFSHFPIK